MIFDKFADMTDGTVEKIKTCPQCNDVFACSPVDCWCSKLPPVMPMVAGAECYCPSCLNEQVKKLIESK